ncbi:acetylcholine receptor subunit alpha [Elysia marginata]|uniref:Acetylcholine receptor subunit alpha n=1 Tax=Elysia marginata TaxID=1093978 RepID=A0AAV4HEX1_9GAST|nr:acetylcholine receptor subunit alpha [Elysia marginata]
MEFSSGKRWLMLALSLYAVCGCVYGAFRKDDYQSLTDTIFVGYDKRIRPTVTGGPTVIDMVFEPVSIISLDESSQVLSTFGRLYCEWSDEVLAWDEGSHSGVTNFFWPQDDVWLPDIIIHNSVEEEERPGYKEMPVNILSSGKVVWVPSFIFRTSCDMDVTYYPFDSQVCSIIISTKMSAFQDIAIQPGITDGEDGMSWETYHPSGVWDLRQMSVVNLTDEIDEVTKFEFKLTLKRRPMYYIINIIIPVLFLSLTASLVFSLPADAGEKVGMSMTVLLAYAVYLTIIADKMPQTSSQVSLLACYLTTLLAVTAFGVVLSVFILSLHHTSSETPVGPRTEAYTRRMRKYLRLGYHPRGIPANNVSPAVPETPVVTFSDVDSSSTEDTQGRQQAPTMESKTSTELSFLSYRGKHDKPRNTDLLMGSFMSSCSTSTAGTEERETITWPKVAETVDRLLFLGFSFIVFGVTVTLLPYMASMT